ncbi:hypothetical protein [Phage vB_RanS_PJN03]|nr:hypothetical protein [Phage vB_RanS_PJN03]
MIFNQLNNLIQKCIIIVFMQYNFVLYLHNSFEFKNKNKI